MANFRLISVIRMSSSFLHLPSDVVSVVLLQWLTLSDLVKLDTSLCQRTLRKSYLSLLPQLPLKAPHTPSPIDCAFYIWAFNRKFQVLRLQLHDWHFTAEKTTTLQNIMKLFGHNPNRNPMYKWLKAWLPVMSCLIELHLVTTTVGNQVLNNALFTLIGQSCPHLQSIALSSAPAGFDLPSLLPIVSSCRALSSLSLRGCVLTDDQIDVLPLQLKSLSIHYTNHHAMSKDTLIRLGQRCACLHKLDVYSMVWERKQGLHDGSMPTDVFRVIGAHFPQLIALRISTRIRYAECCTDISVHCPQLKELCISGFNVMITSVQLMGELLRMTQLQVLKITCARNVGHIVALMNGTTLPSISMSKITHLEFADFVGLTDNGLIAILRCCPQLNYLYIRLSSLLTPLAVEALSEHCPKLSSARFRIWKQRSVTHFAGLHDKQGDQMYEEDDTEAVIDLCIADTQLENATVAVRENFIPTVHFAEQSADVTVHNQHTDEGWSDSGQEGGEEGGNNNYFDMQHTQVDDGIYSDEEEEQEHRSEDGGGDRLESTQVDEEYYRRMAESEEPLLNAEEHNNAEQPAHPDGDGSGMNNNVVNEDGGVVDEGGDDDGTESDGSVDFCIADTQVPPSRHPSLMAPRKPSIPTSSQHTPQVEAVTAATHSATEAAELTVYDYLSLSAPMSGGEVPKQLSSTPAPTPIFSALDALPASATLETNAFMTAKSGTTYTASALSALPRQSGATVEVEEPTQLDGSIPHSSASQSVGKSEASLRDSASKSSRHSHEQDGAHGQHDGSSSSSLSGGKSLPANTYTSAAQFATPAPPPAVAMPALPAHLAKRSATESGEWLTAKRPDPTAYVANNTIYAAVPASPPQRTAVPNAAATAKDMIQNARDTSAGESETQLGLKSPTLYKDTPISTAFGGSLEDKSIEELVLMQQRLNQLISSKAQKLASPSKVTSVPQPSAAHPVNHNPHGGTSSRIADSAVSAKSAVSVPLARQETNYETQQSQNSNSSAVVGLIMLKNDQTAGATAVTSPAGEGAGRRKFHTLTPSAASAAAAANAVNAGMGNSAGAPLSDIASPESATKKHFKRKLGANKLAPLAEESSAHDANQFEMSCDDSDVASPRSSDDEQTPAAAKRSKPSPAKAAAPQKTKPQVGFSVPTPSTAVTTAASVNVSNAAKKAADTGASASNSSVGSKGVSKLRRIIIDDTQDDDDADGNGNGNTDGDNGADDSEAEFDDANQSVTTPSAYSSKRNSAGASAVAGGASTEVSAVESLLPVDIPVSFLHYTPIKFTELWHALTDKGWHWKRGGGIVSYYYIRPGCVPKKPFVSGQDYFADEQEVVNFVSKIVRVARASMPPPPPPPVPAPVPAPVPVPIAAPVVTALTAGASAAPVTNTHALSSQLSMTAPPPLVLPDDPIMRDIRKIPWKWLWKILREKGWTWDFGPTHKDFFYAPGFDAKSKNSATLGVEKFDSEESVRRFVRKQEWPEFCDPAVSERKSQGGVESQAPDAYLHDPSWMLASHRQKRERERKASSGSDSESEQSESVVLPPTKQSKKSTFTAPSASSASSAPSAPSAPVSGKSAGSKAAAGKAAQSQAAASGKAGSSSYGNSSRSSGVGLQAQAQVRNFSPFKGAQQHSQQQDAEQATQAQHGSPASPMRSIRGSITIAAAPSNSNGGGSNINNNNFFEGHRFVVSGIPEKLKAQLVKEISRRGGSILPSAPIDGNENMHDRLVDEKTGRTYTRGPVHVVSHPREFRKPNYLLALATGVDLLHFQWVQDCVKKNQFLEVQDYILPTGCCALSGFNVFPTRYGSGTAEEGQKARSSRRAKRPALSGTPPAPVLLLENVKVLNFAGSSWDNVLLATGATTIQNNAPLLQSLLSLTSNAHKASHKSSRSSGGASAHGRHVPVDLILVDPYEYSLSLLESAQSSTPTPGRYATPNSLLLNTHAAAAHQKKSAPSSALKIGAAELQAIQKCVESLSSGGDQSAVTAVPIVVTTDWLVHCLAMGRLLDFKLIDFFALPSDPVKRLFTHKMDSVQGTGERYSKYDIVYYTNPRSSGAGAAANVTNKATITSSPVKAPKTSDALCMGRIDCFVRRDEKSPLMVRIRPLVRANTSHLGPRDALAEKELSGDPQNALSLIEVGRLAGKLVLLHKDDFLRVSQYSVADDCVYYASEEWLAENPCVLDAVSAKSDDSDAGSEGESEPYMCPQRSQDY